MSLFSVVFAQELPEIKLFNKWSTDDVVVNDISLTDYIAVKEKFAKYLPHSAGRYAAKRFRKAQVSFFWLEGDMVLFVLFMLAQTEKLRV